MAIEAKELNIKIIDILAILKKFNIDYAEYIKNRQLYVDLYKKGFQALWDTKTELKQC